MIDPVVEADTLTVVLRDWLKARPEPAPVIGTAMIYELVALIAREASTLAEAHTLLETFAKIGHDQLRRLGLGDHP